VAPPLIAIVGPTASGKSALALRLARATGGEIVSCDSLQVYRGLDIGSAKPSAADRARIRHHLIDVADVEEVFSAAEYARLARTALQQIRERGVLPVVVGGTGLYLRALLGGLFEGPARDEALRRRLEAIAERRGDASLHRWLGRVDPEAARRIPMRDRVRIIRALEVYWNTGRPISAHHRGEESPLVGFSYRIFGIDPGREELRKRVGARMRAMLDGGWLDEVKRLLARGVSPSARPLQAIGYRQVVALAEGRAAGGDVERDIVTETMRYAKRQMTWFRNQLAADWFDDATRAERAIGEWLSSVGRSR
jgi:tRNA dimethylallyltransferase